MGWDETSDTRGLSNLYAGAHSAVKINGKEFSPLFSRLGKRSARGHIVNPSLQTIQ